MIRRILVELRPQRIACLGSGYLNDIPLNDLVLTGGEVYLVDWISGISEEGFRGSLIQGANEEFSCFLCDERCDPGRYCSAFQHTAGPLAPVCDNFRLQEKPIPHCASYRHGVEPRFINADVTLGRASWFARRAKRVVHSSKSLEQSFKRAIRECARCSSVDEEIPIQSNSMDLVTSSMVISQFDYEPYAYFSNLLAERFSTKTLLSKEKRLRPLMESLRAELFSLQVQAHAKEMHRIVNKERGKVYFSVELFRTLPQKQEYFLVHEMTRAIKILADYFHFDFQTIPPERALRKSKSGEGYSLVQCFLLTPVKF